MKRDDRPLTEEEKVLIRRWAANGVSYREIGVRLRRTKNSIVGHVHRLELPSRPSPIIRTGPRASEPRHRRNHQPLAAGKSELPPLSGLNGTHAPAPVSLARPQPRPAQPPQPKPPPGPPKKWSKADDDLLIELRSKGELWTVIGARFGVTGHAVEHRARRLGVPKLKVRRLQIESDMDRSTLPVLESQMQGEQPDIGVIRDLVEAFAKRRRRRQREPKIVEVRGCRYPLWGSGRPTHEFCNADIYRGSWCEHHYHVVFYKQSTRDNAA